MDYVFIIIALIWNFFFMLIKNAQTHVLHEMSSAETYLSGNKLFIARFVFDRASSM
jgi:hypothetical protein